MSGIEAAVRLTPLRIVPPAKSARVTRQLEILARRSIELADRVAAGQGLRASAARKS
jgi:hypothetical protein